MRKMDDIIGNLFEFAPDFFASLRAQFDCFAGAALQDAKDSPVGLQIDLLGPVEARVHGRPVALGGQRPRALFAVLALMGGRVVEFPVLS